MPKASPRTDAWLDFAGQHGIGQPDQKLAPSPIAIWDAAWYTAVQYCLDLVNDRAHR